MKKKKIFVRIFLWILIILYASSLFADFLAPYSTDYELRRFSYAPPVTVRFFHQGSISWPFIYDYKISTNIYGQKIFSEDYSKRYFIKFLPQQKDRYFLSFIPIPFSLFGVESEAPFYLLGADSRGRDIFSRLLFGGRISLSIGLIGAIITCSLGLIIGTLSGYFGSVFDTISMRLCELIMLIPSIYLLLALRAIFPIEISSSQVYLLIIVILSFIAWANMARVVRGLVRSIKEKEFVLAAKAMGQSHYKIMTKHIIPHTYSYLIVALTLSVPSYILGESVLSFLGLGIHDPAVSWGYMLSEAANIFSLRFHPWLLWPGFAILLTVLSYNVLGDALADKKSKVIT